MKAQTFDQVYLHIQCRRIAAQARADCVGHESPTHPSWAQVAHVLEGTHQVTFATNGFPSFTPLRAGGQEA